MTTNTNSHCFNIHVYLQMEATYFFQLNLWCKCACPPPMCLQIFLGCMRFGGVGLLLPLLKLHGIFSLLSNLFPY